MTLPLSRCNSKVRNSLTCFKLGKHDPLIPNKNLAKKFESIVPSTVKTTIFKIKFLTLPPFMQSFNRYHKTRYNTFFALWIWLGPVTPL